MFDYSELKEFVLANPDVATKDVVEKFNCTSQQVYTARHAVGVSKPSTMPKKKRLKVVRKATMDAKDQRIQELEGELRTWMGSWEAEMERIWDAAEAKYQTALAKSQDELTQAKAVIAYLEKKVAHGASV